MLVIIQKYGNSVLKFIYINTDAGKILDFYYTLDNKEIKISSSRDELCNILKDRYEDIFVTNLKTQDYWVLGLFNYTNLKSIDYVKPDLLSLCRLFNIEISENNVIEINRIVKNIKLYHDSYLKSSDKEISKLSISDEILNKIKKDNGLLPPELDEIFTRSYQEVYINKPQEKKALILTLKKHKVSYFNELLTNVEIPKTLDFEFLDSFQLPDEKLRYSWLSEQNLPYIAKIEFGPWIGSINEISRDMVRIQQVRGYGGKNKTKNYATNIEMDILSKYNNIKIQNVFLFKNKTSLSNNIDGSDVFSQVEMALSNISASCSMYNEMLIHSLISKSKNPINNTNSYVQINDVFAKSYDMSKMLEIALMIRSVDIDVVAFGGGNITVSCNREDIDKIKNICMVFNLQSPKGL